MNLVHHVCQGAHSVSSENVANDVEHRRRIVVTDLDAGGNGTDPEAGRESQRGEKSEDPGLGDGLFRSHISKRVDLGERSRLGGRRSRLEDDIGAIVDCQDRLSGRCGCAGNKREPNGDQVPRLVGRNRLADLSTSGRVDAHDDIGEPG